MWKSISDNYEASDDGHIRRKKTKHILHEFVGKDGYLRTQFDGKSRTVHRVIANAFIDKINGKDFVNHKDGNKKNNQVENLEWCTRSENMYHAYSHNLKTQKGEANSRCKLSKSDVRFIKKYYKPGNKKYGAKALSIKFGVAPQTISAVISGQNWSHLSH